MQEAPSLPAADAARRFGGLQRLHGPQANVRLADAHVAIAGIGGVGSWTAEALARSGVGALTLIDLDHVSESNINRQIHALDSTLGAAKVQAMAERIGAINPACRLTLIDDFVDPDNVATLLAGPFTAIVDATDQAKAKIAMILHARRRKIPLIVCGGAGGKTDPLALRAGDIADAVNDALLARLRNELRKHHGYPRAAPAAGKTPRRVPRMHVRALWVDEQVRRPAAAEACDLPEVPAAADALTAPLRAASAPQGLSCAGYGSIVTVTAAMGLAAAHEALRHVFA